MIRALLIPVDAPPREIELQHARDGSLLDALQQAVGGYIESVPLRRPADDLTLYVNGDGKYECVDDNGDVLVNRTATRWLTGGLPQLDLEPGGLWAGDFIAGPALLVGHDGRGGSIDVPDGVLELAAVTP